LQELPRHRTSRADEIEKDLGAAAGDAINPKISLAELAVLHPKFRKDDLFRIGVIDAHLSHGLDGLDETT